MINSELCLTCLLDHSLTESSWERSGKLFLQVTLAAMWIFLAETSGLRSACEWAWGGVNGLGKLVRWVRVGIRWAVWAEEEDHHGHKFILDSEYWPCSDLCIGFVVTMSGKGKEITPSIQKKIDAALLDVSSDCGRCGAAHPMKHCPMPDGEAYWKKVKVGNRAKEGADHYMRNHSAYVGPLDATPVASFSTAPVASQTAVVKPSTSGDHDESQLSTSDTLADLMDGATLESPKIDVVEVQLGDAPDIGFDVPSNATSNLPAATYVTRKTYRPDENKIRGLLEGKTTHDCPLRTAFRDVKKFEVVTNHFEVIVDPKARFYEYQIIGIPDTERRAGKKRFMDTVIDIVQFLNTNQGSFATDSIDRIISWEPLLPHAPDDPIDLIKIKDGERITDLKFTYNGVVDI